MKKAVIILGILGVSAMGVANFVNSSHVKKADACYVLCADEGTCTMDGETWQFKCIQ